MNISVNFNLVRPDGMSKQNFAKLSRWAGPVNFSGECIEAHFDGRDPRMAEWIERAESSGFTLRAEGASLPEDIHTSGQVQYGEAELQAAKYLQAEPFHLIGECTRETLQPHRVVAQVNEMHELHPETKKLLVSGKLLLARGTMNYVVSDTFLRAWEKSGLRGLRFLDVFSFEGPGAKRIKHKYWACFPTGELPNVTDRDLVPEIKAIVGNKALAQAIGRIHFRTVIPQAALDAKGPFDIARTDGDTAGFLIGSAKFRKFCDELGAAVIWQPVEIV